VAGGFRQGVVEVLAPFNLLDEAEKLAQGNPLSASVSGIDHLVFGAPRLEEGMDHIERLLGVRPIKGGRHPNWGTHNALLSLGPSTYLEVVAPDPETPTPTLGRLFGVDVLKAPRLVTWALRSEDLLEMVVAAAAAEVELGPVSSGSREKPDGTVLKWRLTDPYAFPMEGAVPFLISWGDTPHPASTAPRAGTVEGFRISHPEEERVTKSLSALGMEMSVARSDRVHLAAALRTPSGLVELS
jgi:hypothetical protein